MLDTKYNHEEVEKGKYSFWQSKGYFKSGDKTKKPYCIVLPPPTPNAFLLILLNTSAIYSPSLFIL